MHTGFYTAVDLTDDGLDESMREFSFSVNLQLSEAPIGYVRSTLHLAREQHERKAAA